MHIGQAVVVRHLNQVCEGRVVKIFEETLEIELNTGECIQRAFWEIRKVENTDEN